MKFPFIIRTPTLSLIFVEKMRIIHRKLWWTKIESQPINNRIICLYTLKIQQKSNGHKKKKTRLHKSMLIMQVYNSVRMPTYEWLTSVRNKRWPGGQWLPKTPSGHRVSKSGCQNGHRQFLAPKTTMLR